MKKSSIVNTSHFSWRKKSGISILILILFLNLFFISFISAGQLKVTEEHPFLINGSWIPAHDLKVGDVLQTADGKKVRITNLTDFVSDENFSVYNLEAGIYHDFVVDGKDGVGVVVHNSNLPEKKVTNLGLLKSIDPQNYVHVMKLRSIGRYFTQKMIADGLWTREQGAIFLNELRYHDASKTSAEFQKALQDVLYFQERGEQIPAKFVVALKGVHTNNELVYDFFHHHPDLAPPELTIFKAAEMMGDGLQTGTSDRFGAPKSFVNALAYQNEKQKQMLLEALNNNEDLYNKMVNNWEYAFRKAVDNGDIPNVFF